MTYVGMAFPFASGLGEKGVKRRSAPCCTALARQLTTIQDAQQQIPAMCAKACELGLEGIVSKREGRFYRSGKGRNWFKTKNSNFVRT
jgi:ATP-dependent DNA ligase